jgi:hypothetical protein
LRLPRPPSVFQRSSSVHSFSVYVEYQRQAVASARCLLAEISAGDEACSRSGSRQS